MMRLKICFDQYSHQMRKHHMNRIALSINSNHIITIKDLKKVINKEIVSYGKIESLLLKDDYLLLETSKVKDVIKDDDELLAKLIFGKKRTISFISCQETLLTEQTNKEYIKERTEGNNKQLKTNLDKNKFLHQKLKRKGSSVASFSKEETPCNDCNQNITNQTVFVEKKPYSESNYNNTLFNNNHNENKKMQNLTSIEISHNIQKEEESYNLNKKQNNQLEQNVFISHSNLDMTKFILIPSDKLDNLAFLQVTYSKLFQKDTIIKMKIHELLPSGPGIGNYKIGSVIEYSTTYSSFLIQLIQIPELSSALSSMYDYDIEANIISVQMKNFVEIWIYDLNANQPEILDFQHKNQLVLPFIRKQVEYYFSDKNYYKDQYLLLKAAKDPENFIPIDDIMTFNKIKIMTQSKDILIESIKDLDCIELNSNHTKIRKNPTKLH